MLDLIKKSLLSNLLQAEEEAFIEGANVVSFPWSVEEKDWSWFGRFND